MEEVVKAGTQLLARLAEVSGAVVIGYAIVRALVLFVLNALSGPGDVPKEAIRLGLGRSLALGLEFLLGADILNTAIAPTWEQVGLLAAIATIRTALNYFLQQELDRAASIAGKPGAKAPRPVETSTPGQAD